MKLEIPIKLEDQSCTVEAEVTVTICGGESGIAVELHNEDGISLTSVVVEVYEGKLQVHVWNEHDEGNDPTQTIVLAENAIETQKIRFDEGGNIIVPQPPNK